MDLPSKKFARAGRADGGRVKLCMRGYHFYSDATAGEELLCESEPMNVNTKDSNCYAYSA